MEIGKKKNQDWKHIRKKELERNEMNWTKAKELKEDRKH